MSVILFLDDWNKVPQATVHTETKNKSFLHLALLYKEMGIKNHAFPLALLNPELKHIDPHNPNISIEEQLMVSAECKLNFWYFIREVAIVPGNSGSREKPFRASRGNIASYWLFFNHIMYFLIQPRQTGKSFGTDWLITYLLNIRCTDTQINLLTKDEKLRVENVKRIKELFDELPFYLKAHNRNDIANTERITIGSLNNTYNTHLPSASKKRALNLGRGLVSPIFQIDEPPFQSNIEISLPAALAAGTAAREHARLAGEPYGTILTTTAGKKDDPDGKFIYNMLQTSALWTEFLLDSRNQEHLEELIRSSSAAKLIENNSAQKTGFLRVNATFSHRQLGFDDQWLTRALEDSTATGDNADRDFFNVWTSGNLNHPIPLNILELIRASEKSPLYVDINNRFNYMTRWYIPKDNIPSRMSKGNYIVALDTSDAAGGDDISLVVVDIQTGEVIADGNYNETNLLNFALWLVHWLIDYNTTTMIIERRSSAAMLIDTLVVYLEEKGIDPFRRLFNRVVNDVDIYPERYKEITRKHKANINDYNQNKKHFGYSTSSSGITSRNELYVSALRQATKVATSTVHSKKLIDQIMGLVWKNERIDHEDGGHDDMVIAWLLAFWFMFFAKNIQHYGINSKDILINNRTYNERILVDQEQQEFQHHIRNEIETLYNNLLEEKDEFIQFKIEKRMRYLTTQLELEDGEHFSIDDVLENIRKRKYFNQTKSNYYK